MNKNLGPKILALRKEGKSYNEIVNLTGASKSAVCYHCGKSQKEKNKQRGRKNKHKHPYLIKLYKFQEKIYQVKTIKNNINTKKRLLKAKVYKFLSYGVNMNQPFTLEDVINKFGESPKCYLTGTIIDIYDTKSYQFDHIIPVSRGGTNSIENLGICTRQANQAKRDMTPAEFIALCKSVVANNN